MPKTVIFFKENGTLDDGQDKRGGSPPSCPVEAERAVIPGFYGAMPNGTVKTFSRGGSDVTGAIVARAIGADMYENWTDVSGFMMADPRIVAEPLASSRKSPTGNCGSCPTWAPRFCMRMPCSRCAQAGIPINIRNTNRP